MAIVDMAVSRDGFMLEGDPSFCLRLGTGLFDGDDTSLRHSSHIKVHQCLEKGTVYNQQPSTKALMMQFFLIINSDLECLVSFLQLLKLQL